MDQKKRIIEVVEYDPKWPEEFEREARAISVVLRDQDARIHHIGSTAVPGLKAKPVIDIMLEVKDVAELDAHETEMKNLGYIPKGEYGIPGRRFYLKGLYDRTHHIHAFKAGSPDVQRHIAFRNYLIANPSIAREYEKLKVRCANICNNDIDKYCSEKSKFIQKHEKKAIKWMNRQQTDTVSNPDGME